MAELAKVTDPNKKVTDGLVLKRLAEQGIDKDYVEFWHDYAPRSLGKEHSPYAKFYRDLKSSKRFMVVSGLPMVKPNGTKIEAGWKKQRDKYVSKPNLFSAIVEGKQVKLICLSDQPYGAKKGDQVIYQPQLFLNNMEHLLVVSKPTLLDIDPLNPNYAQNVLEWDYGICKRRLRIIEGRIHGYWIFSTNPHGEVRVKYNQLGNFRLKLGEYKVNEDEEIIPQSVFDIAEYPFAIGDSATYYPDADPETSSVDGMARDAGNDVVWATIITEPGSLAYDSLTALNMFYIVSSATSNQWAILGRGIFLFYTAGLPDEATISAAVLSIYGREKGDSLGITGDCNIYSSAPVSNTSLVPGDFNSLGSTAFSTPITYAGFSVIAYNDFTLNASGIANISKIGVSKFGARNANYDVAANAPDWTSELACYLSGWASEQGTGFKPKLVVTYAVPTEYEKTLTESLGLVDKVAKAPLVVKTERIGLVDAVVKTPSLVKTEPLGLVDSYSRTWAIYRTYTEPLGLMDTVTTIRQLVKVLTELLGLSDTVKKDTSKMLAESLGLLDVYGRTWSVYRTYDELLGLADSIKKDIALHPLMEPLGLADSVVKFPSIIRDELLGLKDSVVKDTSVARTELLGLVDTLTKDISLPLSEVLGLLDTYTCTLSIKRTFTETLGLDDRVSKHVSLHALTEVLGLLDSISYSKNPTVLAKLIRKYLQLVDISGGGEE